jgi:hypothetical protein
MAEKETKSNGKDDKPPETSAFDDSEFFTSEGVTDDDEKEAIRARARVTRYATWRATKEAEAADPKKKKKSGKPWYKED